MVVWGGYGNDVNGFGHYWETGGRYDPATDSWVATSTVGAPVGRESHTAVWTGSEMVVWGGYSSDPYTGFPQYFDTGGRYDPATDSWMPTSTVGAPPPREYHRAVWTGSEMVVWGGFDYLDTGGRYDPATDTWTPTSTVGAPSLRRYHTAVWTGKSMVVWGGFGVNDDFLDTGGRYDPATDAWTPTSTTGAPAGRYGHTAVWTGRTMVVWGGFNNDYLYSGGRYFVGGCAAPVADAGPDQTLECTGDQQATATLDGSGSTDPDSTPGTNDDIASFNWSEGGTPLASGFIVPVSFHLGAHEVTLTVTDEAGATGTDDAIITVRDTTPPVITCPAPISIECQGNMQSMVTVPDATATDVCQPNGLAITNSYTPNGADASGSYPLGTTVVTFTATDGSGNQATCRTTVTVSDSIPPAVTAVASPNVLWPPDHEMVPVSVTVVTTDACDPAPSVLLSSVTSSEPDDAPGEGSGHVSGDIQGASIGTADFQVLLRAERDGGGPGRTYTITYQASDHSGNSSVASARVTVPHDMGRDGKPLGDALKGTATRH
jgi:N-acetylneuraminic acid mutarotase